MTPNGLAGTIPLRGRINLESLGDGLVALSNLFRPSDGWLSVALLAVNLMVVIWSVEKADWVPTPSLVFVLLLAMAAGMLLSRVHVWSLLVLPVGVALGLLVIVWQLTSFESREVAVTSADQLWSRLSLWLEAAKTGSINIDSVPFAFGILVATWLAGFLATWVFFRYRNFWGVFVLGGTGLLSNLTYLPPNASVFLGLWLFTGFLLIARVQSVRRRREWDRRNVVFDGHLGLLSFSDSFFLAIGVVVVAFFMLPVGGKFGPANDAYEFFRTPLKGMEYDFNRLFAGLPARKPLGFRIWGDVMAFQGTIHPTTAQVLWVESPVPMYWKARTYGTYTSKGWISEGTVLKKIGWVPPIGSPQPYLDRFEVSYRVTPFYSSRTLFAGDQVVGVDRDVLIETYESPTYTVDFTDPGKVLELPPKVVQAATKLQQTFRRGGAVANNSSLAAILPGDFRLTDVTRGSQGIVQQVVLADVLPEQPDVLSLRSPGREIKSRDAYEITSSVSQAKGEQLRYAGTDYPTWALERYTQLPDDLPRRVRNLASDVTYREDSPYEKAKAIEEYLSSFPYTLVVDPPPFDADGVDHFLFTLRQGYSEYFASAMTVMLRSVGIPARLATGYTTGDKVLGEDIYVVTDSHSHGWVEAYMPGYGWIPFEPTPGKSLPSPAPPELEVGVGAVPSSADGPIDLECLDEIEDCEEGLDVGGEGSGAAVPLPWGGQLVGVFLWLVVSLAVLGVVAGLVSLLWRKYMVPSDDPQQTFRRLAFLGSLAALKPVPYQTPYQYQQRLSQALPAYGEALSVIIDYYVRSLYGRKQLDDEQRLRLAQAWLRLRLPLLLKSLRRGWL